MLEGCLASIENAKYGLTFSSGLGVTTCIITLLKSGDHIVAGDDLYGGTNRLFRNVAVSMGIEVDFVDFCDLSAVEKAIKSNTKVRTLIHFVLYCFTNVIFTGFYFQILKKRSTITFRLSVRPTACWDLPFKFLFYF